MTVPSRFKHLPSALVVYDGRGVVPPEIEQRFFMRLRLPNGTYKTTYRHRLDDVNDCLMGFLPTDRRLDVMDVAVSSGVSTLEWSEQLRAEGIDHKMVGSDLVVDAWLTSFGSWLAVLCDDTGRQPLLFEVGPIKLPVRSDRWLGRAARPLLSGLARLVAALGRRMGSSTREVGADRPRWGHRPVPLISSDLQQARGIEIVQDDITVSGRFTSAFDVIRVANLVQRVYFDDDALKRILSNLRARLRPGGLLVICRTLEDGANHGTIFRLGGDGFLAEGSINDGSEVSDLVLGLS